MHRYVHTRMHTTPYLSDKTVVGVQVPVDDVHGMQICLNDR